MGPFAFISSSCYLYPIQHTDQLSPLFTFSRRIAISSEFTGGSPLRGNSSWFFRFVQVRPVLPAPAPIFVHARRRLERVDGQVLDENLPRLGVNPLVLFDVAVGESERCRLGVESAQLVYPSSVYPWRETPSAVVVVEIRVLKFAFYEEVFETGLPAQSVNSGRTRILVSPATPSSRCTWL
jgi:hypothetical protein